MGRVFTAILAAAGALGVSSVAHAADNDKSASLSPSTPWNVDYGKTKCRLARAFGEGDDRHLLFMEQAGPDDSFGFTVAGPRLDRFKNSRSISIQFGDLPEPDREPFSGTTETFGASIIYSGLKFAHEDERETDLDADTQLPAIDTSKAATIEKVTIRRRARELVFETGNLEEPIKVLNHCALDLVKYWGLDPDKHRAMTKLPEWKNKDFIVKRIQSHYPSSALRAGEQGIFRMRAIVEADGSVSDCSLNNATTTERLESNGCQQMMRAKFEPALDGNGEPMRSFYTTTITYQVN